MTYIPLNARSVTATPDATGFNIGNWTAAFTPAILSVSTQIPFFEIFKMVVTGGAPGTSLIVKIDNYEWDTTLIGWQNAWDPAQPMLVQQGQEVDILFNDPITDNTPATVTVWMRYDPNLAQQQQGGT